MPLKSILTGIDRYCLCIFILYFWIIFRRLSKENIGPCGPIFLRRFSWFIRAWQETTIPLG